MSHLLRDGPDGPGMRPNTMAGESLENQPQATEALKGGRGIFLTPYLILVVTLEEGWMTEKE